MEQQQLTLASLSASKSMSKEKKVHPVLLNNTTMSPISANNNLHEEIMVGGGLQYSGFKEPPGSPYYSNSSSIILNQLP